MDSFHFFFIFIYFLLRDSKKDLSFSFSSSSVGKYMKNSKLDNMVQAKQFSIL